MHRIYNILLCCFGQLSTVINGYSLYLLFVACHLSKQVNQEFMVETDTTVNNTGEDIMRETGENTVPLSNNNKRSMTLVDTENNSVGEDYFPPLKRFQTCSSQSKYERSLSGDMLSYILKQFHSFNPDVELEDSILKYNPIPSMCHLLPLINIRKCKRY